MPGRPVRERGLGCRLPPEPAEAALALDARTYTVEPGDSFWRIAERLVAQRLGREPTDAETGRYWVALVALNEDRVVDADLIFPGQVVDLP